MKRFLILVLVCLFSFTLFGQDVPEKIQGMIEYLNRNNLVIYKDGTIMSNNRFTNQYLNDLITRIGKSSTIDFIVKTKKNGLYKVLFQIRDMENNPSSKLLGNIIPFNEINRASSTLYPMENLDTITLLFRYREKEDLLVNDYIYLLNSMLYKDETLQSMIESKNSNNENSSEDLERIKSMKRDLKMNRLDIIDVAEKITSLYEKENSTINLKKQKLPEEESIIAENNEYINTYKSLINSMKQ